MTIASRIRIVERKTKLMAVFPSSYRRSLLGSGLVCCAFLLMTALASAQDTKTRTTNMSGLSVSVFTYKEIPAATGPCTPEECDWWNRLREAGNKLLRKGDGKSKRLFASVFVEGIEKSYGVPLDDRPSQALFSLPLQTDNLPIKPRNGTVRLSVEYRADGSVGDVKLLNGLGSFVDKRCMLEARNVIFLPAIRDHKFVTEWQTPEYGFHSV